jgi:hypothetical protein
MGCLFEVFYMPQRLTGFTQEAERREWGDGERRFVDEMVSNFPANHGFFKTQAHIFRDLTGSRLGLVDKNNKPALSIQCSCAKYHPMFFQKMFVNENYSYFV